MLYNLPIHGDLRERQAWSLFLEHDFPSYEVFWNKFIVPLTRRPDDISFRSDNDLQTIFLGESTYTIHERICIAQLSYSTLCFLMAAHNSIRDSDKNFTKLVETFSNLYSALDISAELFARYKRIELKGEINTDPFDKDDPEKAKELRRKFQKENKYPVNIKQIRDYRDILIHGRQMFSMATPAANFLFVPKIGTERNHLDWRKGIANAQSGYLNDYVYSRHVAEESFMAVLQYLERQWVTSLFLS